MNLLSQFEQIFDTQEKAFATIIGQRSDGKLVAETPSGATILLTGDMETGKKCFYNRRNSTILSEAPNVTFSEFGV
ncbi:hypothetical protein [Psychrobacter sp. I-STPA10]|uniref:hypothetical protein n=1 Tax=Psychrobacter sp. I-STPA10 TaxID=2585769 RepID=UPI001E3CD9C1|nr:hypothetical protein [Psychrobacter sp. I-STPA10]